MIALAIPTYRCFDLLERCIDSALAGSVVPDHILVVDNSDGQCPAFPGVEIVMGRQPQSVAKAWNDAVQLIGGDVILANDDITFAPDTIAHLLEEAARNERAGIVSAIADERFCLFWLRHAAYLDMGGFDEGYSSAYFEDNHAARVLTLNGWELAVAPSAVEHVGSATIQTYDQKRMWQHHAEFRANQARYVALWGGLPHHEIYAEPAGGSNV
jgi:GT2 family glycosyltransferase